MKKSHTSLLVALAIVFPSVTFGVENASIPPTTGVPGNLQQAQPATPAPAGGLAPTPREIPPLTRPATHAESGLLTPDATRPVPLRNGPPKELREEIGVRMATSSQIPERLRERIEDRDRMGTDTRPLNDRARERVEQAREQFQDARKEQMKEFVRKTIARMRAAIERLTKIADRIDSRIAKMEAAHATRMNASTTPSTGNGSESNARDFSLMKSRLAFAREQLKNARASLDKAEAYFNAYVPPEPSVATGTPPQRPQPGIGQPSPLRSALKNAEESIRAAHQALIDVVDSAKKTWTP